jgi:glycosyltransferase involved in cell wall biosynthesis
LPFAVEPDHPLSQVKHSTAAHRRFLFVGRFQPYKGAHLLLEAFNNLAAPNGATLTLYGTADGYDSYYEQLQSMMAKNERIYFGGRIPPEELGRAFAEADYFVMPSTWHENSPLIVLDALQSKTPVISSAIGGVTDMVKDKVNGLLFPMGDKAALQQLLQQAINRPSLVEQLRSGVTLPDIDDYAITLLELYKNISA